MTPRPNRPFPPYRSHHGFARDAPSCPGGFSITIQEEEELAEEMMKNIHRYVTFIEDDAINQYVNDVGREVLQAFPRQHFAYHFYVIEEPVYNAFATPAGHIFINSGLIGAMESEEELAGIIAHEIAHVHGRHISQKIERSKKLQLLSLAGMVASILIGSSGSADASRATGIGTLAAGQSIALKYSREDEIQADQLGLRYLTDAGFNGSGLLTILKKMRAKTGTVH
jgi:predicted Zn-dependent protease